MQRCDCTHRDGARVTKLRDGARTADDPASSQDDAAIGGLSTVVISCSTLFSIIKPPFDDTLDAKVTAFVAD
jgi:hypothetical protein